MGSAAYAQEPLGLKKWFDGFLRTGSDVQHLARLSILRADPQNQWLRPIPVIALTSYALSSDKRKAYEAGCIAHVTKPYSPRQLLATLREYLQ